MKHTKMKLFTCLFLGIVLLLPILCFTGCDLSTTNDATTDTTQTTDDKTDDKKPNQENNDKTTLNKKINEFYDLAKQMQTNMDTVADIIYEAWYDQIYNDTFTDINAAVAFAKSFCKEELTFIEENDEKIKSLYKEVRDSDLKDEIKAVMSAYSDYYEFVINVSGSFKTYSANKETYKKALATALKDLSMEL